MPNSSYVAKAEQTFLGHPRGLFVLFFTEMWERFSFYGMRGLLIFYLIEHWRFSDGQASLVFGAYASLVYIAPLLGGYLADRYLGPRKAVQFGALLLACGHFLMVVEGEGGQQGFAINIFWLALALIIVGVGFLKANISVMVGQLYADNDRRTDAGYTLFYMGINLGAALGSLISGWLGQTYGWSWGFGVAGVGMLFGLLVFVRGKPVFQGRGESPVPEKLASRVFAGLTLEWLLYLFSLASVLVVWFLVQQQQLVGWLLGLGGALLVGYVVATAVTQLEREERHRIYAIVYLVIGSVLFWALNEQAASSLNLFVDRSVDRHLLGWQINAAQLQSLNPLYIIFLAPLFSLFWQYLGRRQLEPAAPTKFAVAVLLVGLGFLVLVAGAKAAGPGLTPLVYIFLIIFIHTLGELCLSPVGLSAMSRLSPARMAGLIMGSWFFASAAGEYVAGLIAAATGGQSSNGGSRVLEVYSHVGWLAIGVGILMLLIAPLVRRLMHLDTLYQGTADLAGCAAIGEPDAAGVDLAKEKVGSA